LELMLLEQRLIVIGPGTTDRGLASVGTGQAAPIRRSNGCNLSDREHQILACLARGDSNKAIARHCSIAETTVKAHLKAILRKIAVRNRTQAAIWALGNGLAASKPGRADVMSSP
jgi:DNA-binding NarL/FixJ family response regulator